MPTKITTPAPATTPPVTEPTATVTSGAGLPTETRLDTDISKPSTTAPGDGPADTTDPLERASTVGGDKAAAALAGHLTVNAVVPVTVDTTPAVLEGKGRVETYKAARPDGTVVTVTHNIDTGATSCK